MSSIERYVPYDELDTSDDDLQDTSFQQSTSPILKRTPPKPFTASASISKSRSPSLTDSRVWSSLKNSLVDKARRMASLEIAEASSIAEREASLLKQLETSDRLVQSLRDELRLVKSTLESTKHTLSQKEHENEVISQRLTDIISQASQTQRHALSSESQLKKVYDEVSTTTVKMQAMTEQVSSLEHKVTIKDETLKEKESEIKTKDLLIVKLQNDIATLKQNYSSHDTIVANLKSEISRLSTMLDSAEKNEAELRRQVIMVEAQLQAAEEEVQVQSSVEMKDFRTKRRVSKIKAEMESLKLDCLKLMKMLSDTEEYGYLKYELPEVEDLETSDVPFKYLTSVLDNSLQYFADGSPLKELCWWVPNDAVIVARRWARKCLPNHSPEVLNNLLLALNTIWVSRMYTRTSRLEQTIHNLKTECTVKSKKRQESAKVRRSKREQDLSITLQEVEEEVEALSSENKRLRKLLKDAVPQHWSDHGQGPKS
ncbi:hypothetical protein RCL1_007761 [Eukaryota sp. TZLM3-RCL]